mgnify:FL=1|tara:strand:- start:1072 stop:1365 length:294 start_codon:yes stop_codon:yes gene_type:complete
MAISYSIPASDTTATQFAGDLEVGPAEVTLTRKLTANGISFMCEDAEGRRGFLNLFDNQIERFDEAGVDIEASLTQNMLDGEAVNVTVYRAGRCKVG